MEDARGDVGRSEEPREEEPREGFVSCFVICNEMKS